MRATPRRGSRITAARGSRITSRRVYVRDERGRFATTGTPKTTRAKVAKVAAATAGVVAGVTVAGTAVAATTYRHNTAAKVAAYRSAFDTEQAEAFMDYRVNRLVDKHRKRQKSTTYRRKK